jgi:hypothetical protein
MQYDHQLCSQPASFFCADSYFRGARIFSSGVSQSCGNADRQEVRVRQQRGYVFVVREPQGIQRCDLTIGEQLCRGK